MTLLQRMQAAENEKLQAERLKAFCTYIPNQTIKRFRQRQAWLKIKKHPTQWPQLKAHHGAKLIFAVKPTSNKAEDFP